MSSVKGDAAKLKAKKSVSRSSKAGLHSRSAVSTATSRCVSPPRAGYATAAGYSAAIPIPDRRGARAAGNVSKDLRVKRITPRHLQLACQCLARRLLSLTCCPSSQLPLTALLAFCARQIRGDEELGWLIWRRSRAVVSSPTSTSAPRQLAKDPRDEQARPIANCSLIACPGGTPRARREGVGVREERKAAARAAPRLAVRARRPRSVSLHATAA